MYGILLIECTTLLLHSMCIVRVICFLHLHLQLWLCLAALCVIDEEHAEALSSGQWLGQDGKPKNKVNNHTEILSLELL